MDWQQVKKPAFDAFVAAYPRPLVRDVFGAYEPPLLTYNDFTLGDWPASVIARVQLADDPVARLYWISPTGHP